MQAQKAQSHARGYGGKLLQKVFWKIVQFGAFCCILVPILALKISLFWSVFGVFFNAAFAEKSENKENEEA